MRADLESAAFDRTWLCAQFVPAAGIRDCYPHPVLAEYERDPPDPAAVYPYPPFSMVDTGYFQATTGQI